MKDKDLNLTGLYEQTVQTFCWCLIIVLAEENEIGKVRRDRFLKSLLAVEDHFAEDQGRIAALHAYKHKSTKAAVNYADAQTLKARREEMARYCDPYVTLPADRSPRNAKERAVKTTVDTAASMAWVQVGLAVRNEFKWGRVRLERLKAQAVAEYRRSFYETSKDVGADVAYERLRRWIENVIGDKVTIEEATRSESTEIDRHLESVKAQAITSAVKVKRAPVPVADFAKMNAARKLLEQMQGGPALRRHYGKNEN